MIEEGKSLLLAVAPELKPLSIIEAPPDMPQGCCHAFFTRAAGTGNVIFFWPDVFQSRDDFFGALLHEAGHGVPVPVFVQREPADVKAAELEAKRIATLSAEPITKPLPMLDIWHGEIFLRAVLHLHHRAKLLGEDIPLPALMAAGPVYGLSVLSQYRRAIGNEPAERAADDFHAILTSPAPQAFQDLFHSDTKGKKCSR